MKRIALRFVYVLLAVVSVAAAQQPQPSLPNSKDAAFIDVRLKNGLRLLLQEDHSAPVYGLAVIYDVGSRKEVPGRTGFAHLFEHMMFQGSANVGKLEHMLLVRENGGSMNGMTPRMTRSISKDFPPTSSISVYFLSPIECAPWP